MILYLLLGAAFAFFVWLIEIERRPFVLLLMGSLWPASFAYLIWKERL